MWCCFTPSAHAHLQCHPMALKEDAGDSMTMNVSKDNSSCLFMFIKDHLFTLWKIGSNYIYLSPNHHLLSLPDI